MVSLIPMIFTMIIIVGGFLIYSYNTMDEIDCEKFIDMPFREWQELPVSEENTREEARDMCTVGKEGVSSTLSILVVLEGVMIVFTIITFIALRQDHSDDSNTSNRPKTMPKDWGV